MVEEPHIFFCMVLTAFRTPERGRGVTYFKLLLFDRIADTGASRSIYWLLLHFSDHF